jgi:hypothetical protein
MDIKEKQLGKFILQAVFLLNCSVNSENSRNNGFKLPLDKDNKKLRTIGYTTFDTLT